MATTQVELGEDSGHTTDDSICHIMHILTLSRSKHYDGIAEVTVCTRSSSNMLLCFSLSMPSRIHALMAEAPISFRTRLLQLDKRIELRQPALTKNFFGESLRTLARAVAHGQSLCGRQLEGLGEAFCELLFGGSVEACDKNGN
jgi:hypothetical protein